MSIIQNLLAAIPAAAAAATDAYFYLVTLLLPGNGTNGAQNNTFIDSSTNAFSITRNGNTTQGTFSPFSQTGWSNYFDGTGDYLSTADSISLGSGDFTVGCWVYLNATGAEMPVVCSPNYYRSGYNGNFVMRVGTSNLYNSFDGQSSGTDISGTYSWEKGVWTYVAWVRSGSTITVYKNGTSLGTVSSSRDLSDSSNGLYIAVNRINNAIQSDNLNGYISNLRILVGTADTAVPTAPFTAITNTKLLTCQGNRFFDANTQVTAKTITVNGDTSVQAFSPFAPTAAWSAATNGGSGYFDGTGDYLDTSNNTIFAPGTGDFTIEGWFYCTSSSNTTSMKLLGTTTGYQTGGFAILRSGFSANGDLDFVIEPSDQAANKVPIGTFGTNIWLNSWNHFAVARSGSSISAWLNGTRSTNKTNSANINDSGGNNLRIGGNQENTNNLWNGYIAGIKYDKGTAYYTPSSTTITVPTAPPTNTSGTDLLINFTNAGIYDATSKNDLETVADAQISTTQSKFGGSSMYFDGTGDYLLCQTNGLQNFGTGDFTVEAWVYITSTTTNNNIVDARSAVAGEPWIFQVLSGGSPKLAFNDGSNSLETTTTVSTNQWVHVAACRSGSTLKLFINGTSGYSNTNTTDLTNTGKILTVGSRVTGGANLFTGYINDLRITKGYARYTANFTAPTAAFPLY